MRYAAILIVAASLAVLSAAAAFAEDETIAVFTKNQTNPLFRAVRVGSEKAAKSLGAKAVQYIPTKPDSIPEQMSQIEDVIVKKQDAIVFIPVDYKALVPGLKEINSSGIPVVNIVDRISGGKTVAFIGGDDYSLGLGTARHGP